MSAEIFLDTIDDSQVTMLGPSQARIIRGGLVVDVPASVTTDPEDFLIKCIQLLKDQEGIKYGDAHPAWSNSFLSQIVTRGARDTGTTGARIQLVYSPFEGVTPSALIVSVTPLRKIIVTDRIPGTGFLFSVSYDQSSDTTLAIPEDICRIAVRRTVPLISVQTVTQGQLDEQTQVDACDQCDMVNDAPWMGRPKGAWITGGAATAVSKYTGYYSKTITAEAAGRKNEDWGETVILRSGQTGKLCATSVTKQQVASDLQAAYRFGVVTPPDVGAFTNPDYGYISAQWKKGTMRVGCYETTSFPAIFGFGAGLDPFGTGINDQLNSGNSFTGGIV